jgi:hypothetical protein
LRPTKIVAVLIQFLRNVIELTLGSSMALCPAQCLFPDCAKGLAIVWGWQRKAPKHPTFEFDFKRAP